MTESFHGRAGKPFLDDPRQIDAACDQFESLWKKGQKPSIREFIEGVSEVLREPLFTELLSIEVEYRRTTTDPPSRTQYKSEFPEYEAIIDAVFENSIPDDGGPASTVDEVKSAAEPPDISELSERFTIKELVGRGGMGWVYLARRKQFDMDVAIKIVGPDYLKQRFQREAEVLVRLRSPHVVTIHDFEVMSNGTPVLVMEWVDGGDLSKCMRENGGHLKEHAALPWMRQTCEGMRAVSGQGVVHRDLKPSNIMITKDGVVKVADFGMARVPRPSRLSRPGQIMGTIAYISPEQATAPHSVDQRADIYSFGACFYHALTGVPPFTGDTDISILLKHASEPLVAPKARNPEISEATSQLLERCLAKSPDERFQSFDEVLNYLETTPWDRLDDEELSEFVALYQTRRGEYLERRRATRQADVYAFPNGRELRILVGDLASQQTDAVVSSDDWLVSMRDGVAKEILLAAGPEIREELFCVPIRPGRALVTSGGALHARRIFHGITSSSDPEHLRPSHDIISQVMESCFYHADSHYVTSIAFPLLGTGPGGFSEESCLDTMFRFLTRNLLRRATSVNQATIVLKPNEEIAPNRLRIVGTVDLPDETAEETVGEASAIADAQLPEVSGYEFFHHYEQARYAKSDLLEIVPLPSGRVAVVVADVMGHGIGGSVVIDAISAEIKRLLTGGASVVRTLRQLNGKVLELDETRRFVRLIVLILDPQTHQVTVVNAGHSPPLKRSTRRHVTKEGVDCVDIPLGIQKDVDYQSHVVKLESGESLTVVPNGVLDAMNSLGESYNEARITYWVSEGRTVREIGQSIIDDIRRFQGDSPPLTDWCLACIGRI